MQGLQLKEARTRDGLFIVTYTYVQGPADVQDLAFAAAGLDTISPAVKGMLMAGVDDNIFTPYSRTDIDVFYDDRGSGRVVLARGKPISQLFLSDMVDAHKHGREFVIPENMRDAVYDATDTMLGNGKAVAVDYGTHQTLSSRLGNEGLTSFMYGDPSLGIDAQTFGDWLAEQRDTHTTIFDGKEYAARQKGPYLTRLRLCGPDLDFFAVGNNMNLDYSGSAFGVLIKRSAEQAVSQLLIP
ncbi:MAG: hypothetical protein V1740_04275 [Candidatus Woesearchaeota archaeon]